MILKPVRTIKHSRAKIGLGDIVAKVAEPVAAFSDAVLKTNLSNCEGCKKRKNRLNRFKI